MLVEAHRVFERLQEAKPGELAPALRAAPRRSRRRATPFRVVARPRTWTRRSAVDVERHRHVPAPAKRKGIEARSS